MSIQLVLGDKTMEIDPSDPPRDAEFTALLQKLRSSKVNFAEIGQLVHIYRMDASSSFALLGLLSTPETEETEGISQEAVETLILSAALCIQHGKDPNPAFRQLRYVRDKRIDLLKGLFLLKSGEFEDAEFLFSKIGYKFGLERVYLETNKARAVNSTDFRIRCYAGPQAWRTIPSDADTLALPQDLKYRIGISGTFENATNLDVQVRLLSAKINKLSEPPHNVRAQLKELLRKTKADAEIYYLIGKTYHLEGNKEEAVEFYKNALSADPTYKPALWNLSRIKDEPADSVPNEYTSVRDYKALRSVSHDILPNADGCSESVREIIYLAAYLSGEHKHTALNPEIFSKEPPVFEKEVVYNNMAILLADSDSSQAEKLLKQALAIGNEKYLNILEYNLGVLKGDLKLLQDSPFEEALQHIALLTNDLSNGNNVYNLNPELREFIMMRDGKAENIEPLELLMKENRLITALCLGSLLINCFLKTKDASLLDRAYEVYRKFPTSFYAVNGIGVVYALKERPELALEVFKQISSELIGAYINIAKCYALMGAYKPAIMALAKYISVGGPKQTVNLISQLCHTVSDGSLTEWCHNSKELNGLLGTLPENDENFKKDSEQLKERRKKRHL